MQLLFHIMFFASPQFFHLDNPVPDLVAMGTISNPNPKSC